MSTPAPLLDQLRALRLLEPEQLDEVERSLHARFPEPKALAQELLQRGWRTAYQADLLLQGRGRELVLGSYVLLDRLGEGGMGAVFKARHQMLGRTVALKLVRKERLDNPIAVKRFRHEIKAAAQLNNPSSWLSTPTRSTAAASSRWNSSRHRPQPARQGEGAAAGCHSLRLHPASGPGLASGARAQPGAPRHQVAQPAADDQGRGQGDGPGPGPRRACGRLATFAGRTGAGYGSCRPVLPARLFEPIFDCLGA